MRKLMALILLASCTSTADARCTQADLSGRWDLLFDGLSCRFYLDEQGAVMKGTCHDLFPREDRPELEDVETLAWSGSVSVNGHCRVSGSIISEAFCPYGPDEICQEMADENDYLQGKLPYDTIEYELTGRANLRKSVVKGESRSNPYAGVPQRHFSMVKY
jgi:hypothetical protein